MPTAPNIQVIDRDLSVVSASAIVNIGSPLLTEVINYSSQVLMRCATSKYIKNSEKKDRDLAPLVLYRLMIELTDGIEALLSKAIGNPAIPIIRSMFEALISLEFILENNIMYEKRSIAWIVGYADGRLRSHKQFDKNTVQGQQFVISWENDPTTSNIEFPPSEMVQKAILNMEKLLDKPHIKQVYEQLTNERKNKKRSSWYSIDGGPENIKKLSEYLSRGGQYNLLYKQWSGVVHATDFAFIAPTGKKGEGAIKGLRDAKEIKNLYMYATTFLVTATKKMLTKFRPGEDGYFAKWYEKEIKQRVHDLNDLRVEIEYMD